MIFARGNLKPTNSQLAEVKKFADESFCTPSSDEFNVVTPVGLVGYEAPECGVLLRLRNVEPHDDPWVSHRVPEPRRGHRRALFWLMDVSSRQQASRPFNQLRMSGLWFGAGKEQVQLKPGDWILFDDSKTHFVMSDYVWRGATWQLRKIV